MDNRPTTTTTTATGTEDAPRGRGCGCWIALILVLVIGGAVTTYLGATFALQQNTPLAPEALAADAAKRTVMVPAEYQNWRMPSSIAGNAGAIAKGKEVFNVECAMCHGQNGKGPNPGDLGAAMFPPAVALNRDLTQSKSDGVLYYMIFHGINYTGMPAWGAGNDKNGVRNGPHTQDEIWNLVAYIRSIGPTAATK